MIEVPMALALSAFSFLLTVIWGPPLLQVLRNLKIGEHIRIDGPSRHLSKIGTPTMGGILIVIPVLFLTILFNAGSFFGLSIFGKGLDFEISFGVLYVPIATFIIVASSNAVNLTDGLDGLAGLISVTAFITYGAIALMQGQIFLARFCFILVGAIFGFLWFNVYPAELFMGDTGSLALGAVLAVVALMTGQWAILPVIAIIPLSETISVIIQVSYFKLTGGRRVFKMTPLHHHFELSGWSETQVVQRFWLISLVAAIVGIALSLV